MNGLQYLSLIKTNSSASKRYFHPPADFHPCPFFKQTFAMQTSDPTFLLNNQAHHIIISHLGAHIHSRGWLAFLYKYSVTEMCKPPIHPLSSRRVKTLNRRQAKQPRSLSSIHMLITVAVPTSPRALSEQTRGIQTHQANILPPKPQGTGPSSLLPSEHP